MIQLFYYLQSNSFGAEEIDHFYHGILYVLISIMEKNPYFNIFVNLFSIILVINVLLILFKKI
jgi:hypothetical protein